VSTNKDINASQLAVALTQRAEGIAEDVQIRLHLGWLGYVAA
jgi:hypothetical protein